jgi:hypothetical protein
MKASQLKRKRFVQVSDLNEDGNVVTIAEVKQEKMRSRDGTVDNKGVLYFAGDSLKPFPLNNTNVDALADLFGEDVENWIGQQIKLVVREVESFGKVGPGIRIESAKPAKKAKK